MIFTLQLSDCIETLHEAISLERAEVYRHEVKIQICVTAF